VVKYIAFFRAINVSGLRIIKMEVLTRMLEKLGFKNVKTFIQSGNVIFEASDKNPKILTRKIENGLQKFLGYEVTLLLRTFKAVEDIVKLNPFKAIKPGPNVKMYVTFLSEKPAKKPVVPLVSPKKDIKVIRIVNKDVFSITRMQNGRFGFPNIFIEKEFALPATTRNWTTVTKVIK
jgi:uncharacterized protein (DUF1697 family)